MVGLTQTARAVTDPSGSQEMAVFVTATANGAATELRLVAGDNQAAIIDDTLPVPLRVRATNQSGEGVGGVPVVWAAVGGGQVFPNPAVTDAQGEAVTTWTLGPTVGAQTATASVTGLTGSPHTFTATASPAANTLTWTSEQLPGTWSGIWAGSPSDIFAVGSSGTIRHFNGSSWDVQNGGTTNDLYVVWGDAPTNVFAAGSGGTILRYDGATWSPMAGAPSDNFFGVWASSPSDVFVVGLTGLWHYAGSTWSNEISPGAGLCVGGLGVPRAVGAARRLTSGRSGPPCFTTTARGGYPSCQLALTLLSGGVSGAAGLTTCTSSGPRIPIAAVGAAAPTTALYATMTGRVGIPGSPSQCTVLTPSGSPRVGTPSPSDQTTDSPL